MDCRELKRTIKEKSVRLPLILEAKSDNSLFLCQDYANGIAEALGWEIVHIDSLKEYTSRESFGATEYLNMYETDTVNEKELETIGNSDHLLVICKNHGKAEGYVQMPDPVDWQIEAFASKELPEIDEQRAKYLCTLCKHDAWRLHNEAGKLRCFSKEELPKILDELASSDNFGREQDFMKAVDSLIDGDADGYFQHATKEDGIGIATMALKRCLLICEASSGKTPKELGISPKYLNYLRFKCQRISSERLAQMIGFLASVDMLLKTGRVQSEELRDYIGFKMLGGNIK